MLRMTDIEETVLYTPDELAAMLQINKNTLAIWRSKSRGPQFIKYGKFIRYKGSDILSFLDDNVRVH